MWGCITAGHYWLFSAKGTASCFIAYILLESCFSCIFSATGVKRLCCRLWRPLWIEYVNVSVSFAVQQCRHSQLHPVTNSINKWMFIFQDPTACHYMFQDDSYLMPRTSGEFVSVQSGFYCTSMICFAILQVDLTFFVFGFSSTETVFFVPGIGQKCSKIFHQHVPQVLPEGLCRTSYSSE